MDKVCSGISPNSHLLMPSHQDGSEKKRFESKLESVVSRFGLGKNKQASDAAGKKIVDREREGFKNDKLYELWKKAESAGFSSTCMRMKSNILLL